MRLELRIYKYNSSDAYSVPVVKGCVTVKHERNATSTLTFDCVKDETLSFDEGDRVLFLVDGYQLFNGRIFTKTRDKEKIIGVTAYDSVRYLANEGSIILGQDDDGRHYYTLKTLLEKIQSFFPTNCLDFGQISSGAWRTITVGDIIKGNGQYSDNSLDYFYELELDPVVFEDKTFLDMILETFDAIRAKYNIYLCLWSVEGKIHIDTLDNLDGLNVSRRGDVNSNEVFTFDTEPYVIIPRMCSNYSHETTIDDGFYNTIVVKKDDSSSNTSNNALKVENKDLVAKYGTLIYNESSNVSNLRQYANNLLFNKSKLRKTFSISDCVGYTALRGGHGLKIEGFDGGNTILNDEMIVEAVTHKFEGGNYLMDLEMSSHPLHSSGSYV